MCVCVFCWDFWVFSLWVGDGRKGREMREAREGLPVVNESGNIILYLRVGICSNKSGEFCI